MLAPSEMAARGMFKSSEHLKLDEDCGWPQIWIRRELQGLCKAHQHRNAARQGTAIKKCHQSGLNHMQAVDAKGYPVLHRAFIHHDPDFFKRHIDQLTKAGASVLHVAATDGGKR